MIFRIPENPFDPASVIDGVEIKIDGLSSKLFETALPREQFDSAPELTQAEVQLVIALMNLLREKETK